MCLIMTQTSKKDNSDNENDPEDGFYDLSQIQNIEVIKKICERFSACLFFFCWIGFLKIEKVDIDLHFPQYGPNNVIHKALKKLINIKIGNQRINLLEPLSHHKPKHHDIEGRKIQLTRQGREIWHQAKEDRLWDYLQSIPKSKFLKFQDFKDYFKKHFFFDHQEFLEAQERRLIPHLPEDKAIRSPRAEEQEENINYTQLIERKTWKAPTSAKRRRSSKRTELKMPELKDFDLLAALYYCSKDNPRQWKTWDIVVKNSTKLKTHLSTINKILNMKERESKKREYYRRILKISTTLELKKLVEKVKTDSKTQIRLTTSGRKIVEKEIGISIFKREPSLLFIFVFYFVLLIFVPIETIKSIGLWFQIHYKTPLSLLYNYYTWLESFIVLSAFVYNICLIVSLHLLFLGVAQGVDNLRFPFKYYKLCFILLISIGGILFAITLILIYY